MEAIETALRSAMHQAGASALAQLLRYDPPDTDHRTIPCPCGHWAHYKELRSKTMLTVLRRKTEDSSLPPRWGASDYIREILEAHFREKPEG